MQRLALAIVSVLTFVFAGLLEAEPLDAVDAKVDAKIIDVKTGRAKSPIGGGSRNKNAIWWNDTGIVKALSLTDKQRKKMGDYLKVYREKKPPQGRKPEAFHETLVQGNWKKARTEAEKVSKQAETSVRMRGQLKIDVLSLLSKDQHEKLVDRYPRLIYQPWRRAMRDASPR